MQTGSSRGRGAIEVKKGGLNMMIAREGDGERGGEQVEIEWLKRAGAR